MKIVAVSDTHIPARGTHLPRELIQAMEEADMVLHAGDFTNSEALRLFQAHGAFHGVSGNMDAPAVRQALPEFQLIQAEKALIGLVHGWGAPDALPQAVFQFLSGEGVNVIVFGHSHRALAEEQEGVLLFNPGSPTDTVFAPYRSFGILSVEGTDVRAQIVRL